MDNFELIDALITESLNEVLEFGNKWDRTKWTKLAVRAQNRAQNLRRAGNALGGEYAEEGKRRAKVQQGFVDKFRERRQDAEDREIARAMGLNGRSYYAKNRSRYSAPKR